jgi:hypothetical protein
VVPRWRGGNSPTLSGGTGMAESGTASQPAGFPLLDSSLDIWASPNSTASVKKLLKYQLSCDIYIVHSRSNGSFGDKDSCPGGVQGSKAMRASTKTRTVWTVPEQRRGSVLRASLECDAARVRSGRWWRHQHPLAMTIKVKNRMRTNSLALMPLVIMA